MIFNIVSHRDFLFHYLKKTWKLFTGGGGGVCWGRGWVTNEGSAYSKTPPLVGVAVALIRWGQLVKVALNRGIR